MLLYITSQSNDDFLKNTSLQCIISAIGVKYLFPVQAETFNPVYEGHDVIAQASKY